jgi:signal transduction histidine kinase/DNA-binding response OmpR family regulator/CHASE3 domain sensor protein
MNLRKQLIRGQALSWIFVLLVGGMVFLSINRNATSTNQEKQAQAQLAQIEVIQTDVVDLETGMRGYLLTADNQFLEPFNRARSRINQDIATQRTLIARDGQNAEAARAQGAMLDTIQEQINLWLAGVADPEIANIRGNANTAVNLPLQMRGKAIIDEIRATIDDFRTEETNVLDARTDAANRTLAILKWVTAAGLIGAVAASFLMSLWLAHAISQPTIRLARGARRLANGALDERVEETGVRELRLLARAFNDMAEKLEASQADLAGQNAILSEQAITLARSGEIERGLGAALRLFNSTSDRATMRDELLRLLDERHGFGVGALYRYDEWSGAFEVVATHGTASNLQSRFALREGVVGQAVLDRRIVTLENDPLLTVNTGLDLAPARFTVIVPVYYQDRIMAAMALATATRPDEMTHNFLDQLAGQIGIAMQNFAQYANLQTLSDQLQARQTEIEAKNRDLERADQMKSEFLANMSHELRTPLNAIIGFSELLQEQFYGPLNTEQDEYLTNIRTAGEHLLGLINDILDLSKIEAGKMELDREELDLPRVLESSITIVKEKAHNRGVQVHVDAGDTGTITADARKLKQILFNLLSNAVKFTPSGGAVSLTAHTEGAMVEIAVTDTGAGISAEDQRKLFREFMQVDGSLSRRHEGTGLGLALTKRLVELHGGTIGVRSVLGAGSTFTVRMPIARTEDSELRTEHPSIPAQSSVLSPQSCRATPRILVIEDDDPTAELIAAHLESAGYETARACNGEEGLRMARDLKPDGITLDLLMPVMDGWTFLQESSADAELARIPVIVVSLADDLTHGYSLGASAVLGKPIRRDELYAALNTVHLRPTERGPAHVLVVDDDPKAVDLVSDYLTSFGHQVHKAYGGAHGIAITEGEHPDLVILDLMMPEVNGFMVVEKLRENPRTADIPIIVLTAKIVSADERRRLNGHIVAIAEKSGIDRAAFLAEVNRAVRIGKC